MQALNVGWRAVVIGVLTVMVGALVATVVVPRLGGATPFTVLTGSMRPHYPPGTLVVVRPVDADLLRVGDVVTYQLRSGERDVVTHRIVAVGVSLQHPDERVFTTKGDANRIADAKPVRPVQIRGRLWYAVPYLGKASNLMTVGSRKIAEVAAAAGLLAYAGFMFGSAVRDRRRASAGRDMEASHA
jgi:signal peptidase